MLFVKLETKGRSLLFNKTIKLLYQAHVNYYVLSEIAPWADIKAIPFPWHLRNVMHGIFDIEWDNRDNMGYWKDENEILQRDPVYQDEPSYFDRFFPHYWYVHDWWDDNLSFGRKDW